MAAASLLCALADSAALFTVARSVQGVLGGAPLVSLGAAASEFAGHPVLLSAALAAALLFWFAVGPLAVDGVAQLSGWTGLYVGQTVLSAAAALAIYVAGRIEERRCGPGETVAGQPQTDPGSAAP